MISENESVPYYYAGQQEQTENGMVAEYSNDMFRVKEMKQIISDPKNFIPLKQLLGYWAYESEIVVVGGTTNSGKSIFVSDIGFACGTGISWWPGCFAVEFRKKVLVIDSEMNDRQYASRYKDMAGNPNILRATFWQTKYHGDELDDFIFYIEEMIEDPQGPRVVIVDNISTISAMVSPTIVLKLISMLKRLKDDYGCTVIIVTHTNKTSEMRELSLNDFRGSKVFMNMADTVIGIGNTNEGSDTKYLKLMKSRNIRLPETVSLVRISDKQYLHMEYLDEAAEEEVLPKGKKRGPISSITPARAAKIIDMKECGLSLRAIGNNMGLGKSTIKRFLDEQDAKAAASQA